MDVGPDVTLFAALYGDLEPRTPRPGVSPVDAYSLFVARSSAMGWLAPAAEGADGDRGGAQGLWGMNDAATLPVRAPGPGPARVAWFQAGLTRQAGLAGTAPVPLQAFLTCAGDVTARLGELRLAAVRVLLPVPGGGGRRRALAALLQSAGWFAGLDARTRTRVSLTLDGGREPAVGAAGAGIAAWLRELRQDVLVCDEPGPADDGPPLPADVPDALWNGPSAGHRTTVRGSLAEWSPAALGWAAALLAEAAAHHAVPGPLLLTASAA